MRRRASNSSTAQPSGLASETSNSVAIPAIAGAGTLLSSVAAAQAVPAPVAMATL
ncbi:MAG: hypothetical protein JOZ05_18580 [Acetobacteraceae bacterium]|nr:hypothetical protein [Acetobacteraceae bacterium]